MDYAARRFTYFADVAETDVRGVEAFSVDFEPQHVVFRDEEQRIVLAEHASRVHSLQEQISDAGTTDDAGPGDYAVGTIAQVQHESAAHWSWTGRAALAEQPDGALVWCLLGHPSYGLVEYGHPALHVVDVELDGGDLNWPARPYTGDFLAAAGTVALVEVGGDCHVLDCDELSHGAPWRGRAALAQQPDGALVWCLLGHPSTGHVAHGDHTLLILAVELEGPA